MQNMMIKDQIGRKQYATTTTKGKYTMQKIVITLLTLLSVACYSQTVSEPQMVLVQGGIFSMEENDGLIYRATLSSYYIGKYEVTQKEWTAVMGENPSNKEYGIGDNYPVGNVSWDDCQVFINKLNAKTGKKYRLPSEDEWKFAFKGGNKSKDYVYSGSNDKNSVSWNRYNSGTKPYEKGLNTSNLGLTTHPVGQKQSNELGIYDMSGNVSEWCQDTDSCYYRPGLHPIKAPIPRHANKGGNFASDSEELRMTKRLLNQPQRKICGLRLAL